MSTDTQRLSYQRDLVYDYCCERFKELMKLEDHDSALALADEFYEWLDPDQMEQEETLYYNEEEWEKIITPFDELTDIGCDGLFQDHLDNIWIGYNNGNLAVYNSEGITSIKNGINERLEEFTLYQNYPNPFNPSTTISYSIPEKSQVELKVYDVLGREVSKLVNKVQPAGNHEVQFKVSNLGSGVYFYQIRAGNFVESKKMVILK